MNEIERNDEMGGGSGTRPDMEADQPPASPSSGQPNGGSGDTEGSGTRKSLQSHLIEGFVSLRQSPKGGKTTRQRAQQDDGNERSIYSCVMVNFIDPTTSSGAASPVASNSAQKFNFMSPVSGKTGNSMPALDLYDKLTTIFHRDYGSTLHSVPYEHIRSGAPGSIEKLPIRNVLTRSHGAGKAANGDAMVPWGGTSGAAASPMSDPAEWHNGPYCHVYIAACESMDHYRTKIKPALQAFVSQIESASGIGGRASFSGNKALTGNYSAHYLIVYVPIRRSSTGGAGGNPQSASENLTAGHRVGAAIASRVAAARRQISANREASSDSNDDHTEFSSDFSDPSDPAAAPPPGPITHSSKAEKEVYRKFNVDFPNGRTCILSTLMDSVDGSSVATTSPLKNQEWNNFLRMLGAAIVSGFRDRCRRYDEELRRLDAARASNVKSSSRSSKSGDTPRFDLGHFFLVKESLAFTYEQMQLPAEALLQYEELRAFLPEVTGDDESSSVDDKKKRRRSSRRLLGEFNAETFELAEAGDSAGFRRRLRSIKDLGPVEQTVLQYLFSRESSLLFLLRDPVEVLSRAKAFVEIMYRMKLRGAGMVETHEDQSDIVRPIRIVEAEKWALSFCWDIKCACDNFFEILDLNQDEEVREFSFSKLGDNAESALSDGQGETRGTNLAQLEVEKTAASKLCEIMEFARLRFLNLGDTELPCPNPIRSLWNGIPDDMKKPWEPWKPPPLRSSKNDQSENTEDGRDDSMRLEASDFNGVHVKHERHSTLLDGAFQSDQSYESRYLQISASVSRLNRLSGRRRTASRLEAERAELCMRRGEYQAAVSALLPIFDVCATDRWDRGHFWHLFRLACCQRRSSKVPSYLNTLTLCFGPHLTPIAPRKASEFLQKDFEALVAHEQVSQLRLGVSTFVETDLTIERTSGGKSSMLLNFVRKKFVKHFCNVGETVNIILSIRSNLPNPITVNSVQIFLVSFEAFEERFHAREPVSSEDAMEILESESPVVVQPGANTFEFSWTPMTTALCTLSTVLINWKSASFFYDSAALRKPMLGIEVLPSDPTQTIELNPLFLIPGQTQTVRITFHSGSDLIRKGSVELICSEGLQVIPPNSDPRTTDWMDSCEFELPPCEPGGSLVLTTSVKSSVVKTIEQKLGLNEVLEGQSATVQTMQARVSTAYHHELYNDIVEEDGELPTMNTILEAMVTTLDKPAFTVDECSAFPYPDDQVLVSVSLHCNTPIPFSLKEWDISLPQLSVGEEGDLNRDLFGHAIAEGEQLSLSFNCTLKDMGDEDASDEEHKKPTLHVVLQDEDGKTFNQYLAINLDDFYEQMRKDDEFTGINSIAADLSCSVSEGLVGGPVILTYTVDASSISKLKRRNSLDDVVKDVKILFTVSPVECNWIVSGNVKGILDCSNRKIHKLQFVGIPIRPGVLTRFPALSVHFASSSEETSVLNVLSRHPDCFKSLSFVNHMALACPAGIEM